MTKPSLMCGCDGIRSRDRCKCDRCGLFIAVVVERLREPARAYAWGQEDGRRETEGEITTWLLKNGHRAAGLALIDRNQRPKGDGAA